MVLELSALLSSAQAVGVLVKETVPIARTISSNLFARNEEAKRQLEAKLQEFQQNLQDVGKLAWVAEEYVRNHQSVQELLSLCRWAERFLRENLDDCLDRNSARYAESWKVLEVMLDTIEMNRQPSLNAAMDRVTWHSEQDKNQVELRLHDFEAAYGQSVAFLKTRAADQLLGKLGDMTGALQYVQTALQDTLYARILRTLQQLDQ